MRQVKVVGRQVPPSPKRTRTQPSGPGKLKKEEGKSDRLHGTSTMEHDQGGPAATDVKRKDATNKEREREGGTYLDKKKLVFVVSSLLRSNFLLFFFELRTCDDHV